MATCIGRFLGAALAITLIGSGKAQAQEPEPLGLSGGVSTMTLGLSPDDDADTVEVYYRYGYRPYYNYAYRYNYGYGYSNYRYRYNYGYSFPRYYSYPTYRYYGYYASYPRYYGYGYRYPSYNYGAYYRYYRTDYCPDGEDAPILTLDLALPEITEPVSPFERIPTLPPASEPAPAVEENLPYDGGPDRPVPLPREKTTPAPDTGDTLRISLPTNPEPYRYRAYGEE